VPFLPRILALLCAPLLLHGAETFRVATYNVQNYLDGPVGTRPAKSEVARAEVRESIQATAADVLALQEMGSTKALLELRESLRQEGCEYPHWELVHAWDTNIHLAVLSKCPIVAR
jgi:endonuclease/exonuclease/phosphatase family metal-dependent hydrolase